MGDYKMKCKFPDKPCGDRYRSDRKGIMCRLPEWKKKIGVCPYDSKIHSTIKAIRKPLRDKKQKTLEPTNFNTYKKEVDKND